MGEGGFGCVYKARLDDNLYAAVKKLNCENHDAEREFEVMFVSNSKWVYASWNLALWVYCFGLELSFGFAEWDWSVKQNSTSKYNFPTGLQHSLRVKVYCLWIDANWIFGDSIAR